jgi:phosphoribosyl 1,2-cyclic phosphate phosphodiesterase
VHAEPATLVSIERMFRHIFKKEENINDSFVADLVSCPIKIGEPIDRFGVRFEPLRIVHGNLDIIGFRIEALGDEQPAPFPLGYLTDCSAIPPETWPRLSGLKTLVLDMLRYRAHPTHLTADEAVDLAKKIGAEKTWFIHMTHDIGHASLDANFPPGMALAYDGLVL